MSETTGKARILGGGWVTPNGWGMPEGAHASSPSVMPLVSDPAKIFPVQRVEETGPVWMRWKGEPRLRRASPLARFIAAAVGQALDGVEGGGKKRGLIGVFTVGSIVYSRKFYEGALKNGRNLASPALFPETVYNSPLSHTAAIFGFDGPVYSLVGDESMWVEAIDIAALWLDLGDVDEVVVVAAEELDPISLEAFHTAGWLRPSVGYVPAEGAGAVRLGKADSGVSLRVLSPPRPYRDAGRAREVAGVMRGELEGRGAVLPTAAGSWLAGIEEEALAGLGMIEGPADWQGLGGAFAAGAAWDTLAGWESVKAGTDACVVPAWGLHQGLGALVLEGA